MTNIINKVIKNGTEYQIYASGGAAIAVDSELSTTSTNPAQNKVITTAINSKAADNAVVKLTGNQTVAGTKTFSTSPVVPSKDTAASSSNKTVVATEAQVAKKQDALTLPSSPTSGNIVTWGANNKTLADGGSIPTVNNSTITFTQGGVSKGTITTNQSSASTIALDAGGSYDNITKSEIQTGTATTQRTVSASVIKESLPRISSLPNNILTNCELWAGNHSDYLAMGSGRPSTTLFFCIDDGWTPGSNTLLYMPLNSTNTKNDTYGGNTTTQLGTVRYGTYGGVDCADFTSGGCIYSNMLSGVSTYTALIWANNINGNSASNGYGGNVVCCSKSGVSYQPGIFYGNSSSSDGYFAFYANNSSGDIYFNTNTKSHWFLLAMCISSSTKKAYLFGDGSYKELDIANSATNSQYIQIGSTIYDNLSERTERRFYGYLSNLIVENKVWTADEIQAYYNKTKSKYGL